MEAFAINKLELKQDYWMEALSLKYAWKQDYSPMICLTLALSTLSDEIDTGYFILKQEFIINSPLEHQNKFLLNSVVKTKKHINNIDYLICKSEILENKNIKASMSSTLIKINQSLNKNIDQTNALGDFFITITKEQVLKFSELSGDPNYIHKGSNPVVQGMLLLLIIEDYLASKNRFIKRSNIVYFTPVIADCRLYLSFESSNRLSGIVNNIKCFTLTLEEEFLC